MQALKVAPVIHCYDNFGEFHQEFQLGKKDLLVTNQWLYDPYVKPLHIDMPVIFQETYGKGEPSDEMMDAMKRDMDQYEYDRIIAFGGGTIVDICKVLSLDIPTCALDLYTGKIEPKKVKELIVVPTTCGTGSEVTNVAIAELKSLQTKKGIASEETYPDVAVLIPEPLEGLPDYVFATSSIDALIHALESYLSPKASAFTEMYSLQAVNIIMKGYQDILAAGGNSAANRKAHLREFLLASNYAGIAFGNAGCAAVHGLSYSIGAAFHVPHGEANYQFFTEVFKMYMKKNPDGKIKKVNGIFAEILGCDEAVVYEELENVLGQLIAKKPLREYGMTEEQIDEFTKSTIENQQRLLGNNYVYLSDTEIRQIFANLY